MKFAVKILSLILIIGLPIALVSTRSARGTDESGESPLYQTTLRQAYAEMRTPRTETVVAPEEPNSVILTQPTKHPGKRTVCPETPDPTKCPKDKTKCPVIATICPRQPSITDCPWKNTYCPKKREYTKCEVTHHSDAPTQCDKLTLGNCRAKTLCDPKKGGITSCPKVPTRCFKKKTLCPPVRTRCPAHRTKCPVIHTICPDGAEPTKCPWDPTKCPKDPEPTVCPEKPTECPAKPTECPHKPTECPPEPTECHVYTECDVTHRPDAPTECKYLPTVCNAYTWCPEIPGLCPKEGKLHKHWIGFGEERLDQGPASLLSLRRGEREPELLGNSPNPFSAGTVVSFALPRASHVRITAFDVTGRAVSTLVDAEMAEGIHNLNWSAAELENGVYFIRMVVEDRVFTDKATLVR